MKSTPTRILDCGSGMFPYQAQDGEEVVTVDCRAEVKATVTHDLSVFPYPFEDDSFDCIHASHVLEHLGDVIAFMEEAYRLLRPGGKLIVKVPHYSGRSAWCDPTHTRGFGAYWPTYFSPGNHDRYGTCEFTILSTRLVWTREQFARHRGWLVHRVLNPVISRLASWNPKLCERTWVYLVGGFSEIDTVMQAIKPA